MIPSLLVLVGGLAAAVAAPDAVAAASPYVALVVATLGLGYELVLALRER